MNTEYIETLKEGIYNQLYAAQMYKLLERAAPSAELKKIMHNFAIDCLNNASFIDRFYQEEMTSSYNPIVQKAQLQGSFKQTVLWMQRYISDSYLHFHYNSYVPSIATELKNLYLYIAGILTGHSLLLTHFYLA